MENQRKEGVRVNIMGKETNETEGKQQLSKDGIKIIEEINERLEKIEKKVFTKEKDEIPPEPHKNEPPVPPTPPTPAKKYDIFGFEVK